MNSPELSQLLADGLAAHRAGDLDRAQAAYRHILAAHPHHPRASHLLGLLLQARGQYDAAADCFRTALAAEPSARVHADLGQALYAAGDFPAADAAFQHAQSLQPTEPDHPARRAAALLAAGDAQAALSAARHALHFQPNHAAALVNAGAALHALGQHEQAAQSFQAALQHQPALVEAWLGLGAALLALDRLDPAADAFHHAADLAPDRLEPPLELATLLHRVGRDEEALAHLVRAATLRPDRPDIHFQIGLLESARRGTHAAIPHYHTALALDKKLPAPGPTRAPALVNLADALRMTGHIEDAIPLAREAVALRPASSLTHSALLYALHFAADTTPESLLAEHRLWADRHILPLLHARPADVLLPPPQNSPEPGRRLKIAYLSPDFRDHPVTRCLLPLFAHHDREAFEVFLYSTAAPPPASPVSAEDPFTVRCRMLADHWRPAAALSDDQLARTLRADGIDLLIDLSLHMAGNRMTLFALRPAPVQLSFAGYPSTTGNPAIDYRISDPWLDPPGPLSLQGSETIARLPAPYSFWCFSPGNPSDPAAASAAGDTAAAPRPLPFHRRRHITFGSLNNPAKSTDRAFDHWAGVLRAVPDSRLLLLSAVPDDPSVPARFATRGIDPARISLALKCPRAAYLALYHQIDIAIDPFPYTGHSTSLDAFWMGVPVLSLTGRLPISRAGDSLLGALQLSELLATTPEDLIAKAAALASDIPRLDQLSTSLRDRMAASPLMDAPGYARAVESLLRTAWIAWCNRAGP